MSTDPVSQKEHEQALQQDPKSFQRKEVLSSAATTLKASLAEQDNPEEKLKMTIEFMKRSLAQDGTPRFKDFWDAKNLCLPLFKEKISQTIKEVYWAKYTELATEAKRLKEILEEQSSFAIEQIELALKALSQYISSEPESAPLQIPQDLYLSQESKELYLSSAGLITKYVHVTTQLKALRKEVIATEMRVRHKNRFLKEMSKLGDVFIPRKKELIKQVSVQFLSDVERFVFDHFDLKEQKAVSETMNFRNIRDQIQGFQELAKKLSLNSHAFSKSRELLSHAWELMRRLDKEKKKELSDKKAIQQQLFEQTEEKIKQAFAAQVSESEHVVVSKKQELLKEIEMLDLGFHEKKLLKTHAFEMCEELLKPFKERKAAFEVKKQAELAEKAAQYEQYKDFLQSLVTFGNQTALAELNAAYDGFDEKRKELHLSKSDTTYLEELRKELYETILLKRENELEQDQESLQNLYASWEKFKEQTKERLEHYRKEESLSGFDFEKAMMFRELKDSEKARLDRALEKLAQLDELFN